MSAKQGLNTRSSATKRILQEHREFLADPAPEIVAHPLEDDIFEWHVTVRGVENSEYAGGIYHLRIMLKNQYPMQAPDILVMTPSGRFEPNRKICIDGLTSFHEGSWRPAWGVRTAIVGLLSFWSQSGEALAGVGAMNCDKEERKRLAKLSVDWSCPVCQKSNKEIMQDHEEEINVRAVEKFEMKTKNDEKGHALEPPATGTQPISVQPDIAQPVSQSMNGEVHESTVELLSGEPPAGTIVPVLHDSHHATEAVRPSTLVITEEQNAIPAPSPLVRALLSSPPPYLAPLRIAHYHLCKWLCPVQYQQYLPARPDSIAWLDTLIFVILSVLTVAVLSKLSRSWSRIACALFRAFEKLSGIDMSWITEKFSPSRVPDNPYAQYWATGTAAALHGDRTRLRNMDTAIRARDIARRFGRPPRAAGARMPVPAQDPPQMERGAAPPAGDGAVPHAIEL